jgi:integrase
LHSYITATKLAHATGTKNREFRCRNRTSERARLVPLSEPAQAVLRQLADLRQGGGLVFPDGETPLSYMTLTAVRRRMRGGELTAHGFRSTFRDRAADHGKNAHVAEAALAHVLGDKVRAAYERTDLFEQRRGLMDEWGAYLTRPAADVLLLGKRAKLRGEAK